MNPAAAVAYLLEKWRDWLALPARIERLMGEAGYLHGVAVVNGRTEAAERAKGVFDSLAKLRSTVLAVHSKVEAAREMIAGAGLGNELGAIPVAVGIAAVIAAAGMALAYKMLAYQERILSNVEAGILPPEVIGTGGIGGGIGRGIGQALLPIALIGGALLVGSNFLKRRTA